MHATGRLQNAFCDLAGHLVVSFVINEKDKVAELEKIKDVDRLTIDAKKYRNKRSLDANGYFWQLVDKMAKALDTDKWRLYLLQISKYGVFQDVRVTHEALQFLQRMFRYTEVLQDINIQGSAGHIVRCYAGSSTYDTKEMNDLINGTVREAKELGIETLTPDEIAEMISKWKGAEFGSQDFKQY